MKRFTLLALLCVLTSYPLFAQTTLIPFRDVWKYLDNGSNQGTAWRNASFDDGTWTSGNGKLGYGGTDINTVVSFGPSDLKKYITTYFRKKINIDDPRAYPFYTAYVNRDDGIVVYVNGSEVYRNNMPSGPIAFNTLASEAASHDGVVPQVFNINRSAFVTGENTIAIEIHQQKRSSSDIAFDMKLTTPDDVRPSVLSINRLIPANTITGASSVTCQVTFSEPVTGVSKGEFSLIKTGTATGILADGSVVHADQDGSIYNVTISSLTGNGTLALALKSKRTGIKDLAGNAMFNNPLFTGEAYTLDHVSPTILSINRQSPADEGTIAAQVIYRLTFSKPVSGVDEGDFTATPVDGTVNGTISSGGVTMLGTDGSSYDITVNNITGDGHLRLDLNGSGTGITDAAGNPITGNFTGGQAYNFDHTAPSVTGINRFNPAVAITSPRDLTFQVTFSEDVEGVDAGDFTLENTGSALGTLAPDAVEPVGTDHTTYKITVTSVSGTGTIQVELNSGTGITDALGNALSGGFNTGQPYRVTESPAIVSLVRLNPGDANTSSSTVTYRLTLTEGVTGLDAADFKLSTLNGNVRGTLQPLALATSGAEATAAVTQVDAEGSVFDIAVRGIAGNGELRLDLRDGSTGITDVTGNPLEGDYTEGESYLIQSASGFSSFRDLQPLNISSHTAEKPQAKLWKNAGSWWTVLATTAGTKVFRLDNDTWTDNLTLGPSTNSKADVVTSGNITHVLLFRNPTPSFLNSVEYDAASGSYKPWSERPDRVSIPFEDGAQTATMALDGNGRLWIANDGTDGIYLRYSDAPYSVWSAPTKLVSGIKDDDIGALVTLPGKIGLMWSNQNTQKFGFRTHIDGTDPTVWTADEVPAGQSDLAIPKGMSDDHINMSVASDGMLYAAIKTSYEGPGVVKIGLLVRHPDGTWDDLYPVSGAEGTRPVVLVNEAAGKIKVAYTSHETGGDLLYRESPMTNINFGAPLTLVGGDPAISYNFLTTAHGTYNPEIVIMGTNMTHGPDDIQAVSVLASDDAQPTFTRARPHTELWTVRPSGIQEMANTGSFGAYPNPFGTRTLINFSLPAAGLYSITLYNAAGQKVAVVQQGRADAGKPYTMQLNGNGLLPGIYFVQLQSAAGSKTLKLIHRRE